MHVSTTVLVFSVFLHVLHAKFSIYILCFPKMNWIMIPPEEKKTNVEFLGMSRQHATPSYNLFSLENIEVQF